MATLLQLFIRCEKLKDTDTMSKSDPYAVLYFATPEGVATTVAGRTETRKNELNPTFERSVDVNFVFESRQDMAIKVFDDDGNGSNDEVIGLGKFQLAHVVGSRNATLKLDLGNGGTAYISGKEASKAGRDTVTFKFVGKALKNMDFIGKSDPFYKLERILPNGTTKMLFQAKAIDDTLDPQWPPAPVMNVRDLTTGDMAEKTLRFSCFDEDISGSDSMGQFDCSFYELMEAQKNGTGFTLRNPTKPNDTFGTILVPGCTINHVPTFLEFLRAGMQLNVAVSIDFTGSNGDPRNPKSLHYMDPVNPNQYVRAIMSVCDILLEYDTDKMVPAFGFGAQEPMPSNVITHFFHLNGQPNPYVPGVQGILNAYGSCLTSYRLAGPTNFAPTINGVRSVASESRGVYTVLLILTDGEITDMSQTVDAIVQCDGVPMSIVIVGIGSGSDFGQMCVLDGDGGQRLANSRGTRLKRDLVQFVPFNKFGSNPAILAAEVLREVPTQVEQWARAHGKTPGNL